MRSILVFVGCVGVGTVMPRPVLSQDAASVVRGPAIAFSGEVRSRSEWDAPGGAVPADLFTTLRTRLGMRVDADAGMHLLLQAQDSRVLGAEGNAAAARISEFGLHQAYIELRGQQHGHPVALRAGRQEISIGNERLAGVVNWSNLGRSFDGARVTLASADSAGGAERWVTTAFIATVEERGRHFGNGSDSTAHDHVVAGVAGNIAFAHQLHLDATVLYDASGRYRNFTNADRVTVDARLRMPVARRLSVEIEGALQRGHQFDTADSLRPQRQSIDAWLLGIRAGILPGGRRISLLFGVDALSGDANPHDPQYGAFSTLYASNHAFYGLIDVIADPATTTRDRGLADAFGHGAFSITGRASARVEAHRFAFTTGSGGRDLGWEADVTIPIRVVPTSAFEVGYSLFRAGRDAADVGLGARGAVRDWAFVQLRAFF